MSSIVLATRNAGKIRELSAMLQTFDLDVKGLAEFPYIGEIEETGVTFLENARIKARAVAQATGLVAVADDSGLEVDALGGAPGVYSARYAGEQGDDEANNAKLLQELAHVPEEKRAARFRCVMVASAPNGAELAADAAWEGRIALAPAGGNGFGYDPLFYLPEHGCTSAQLSKEDKNAQSHRGQALRQLLQNWPAFWKQATT